MPTNTTTTLSGNFRISVPKPIRTARGWRVGQVFAFIPKGNGLLLVPVPELKALAGLAQGASRRRYRERSSTHVRLPKAPTN